MTLCTYCGFPTDGVLHGSSNPEACAAADKARAYGPAYAGTFPPRVIATVQNRKTGKAKKMILRAIPSHDPAYRVGYLLSGHGIITELAPLD